MVVFLTAHSDAQTAKEGLQAGGCAFLTKPYQLEDLQEAVTEAIKDNVENTHLSIAEQSIRKKKEEIIQ